MTKIISKLVFDNDIDVQTLDNIYDKIANGHSWSIITPPLCKNPRLPGPFYVSPKNLTERVSTLVKVGYSFLIRTFKKLWTISTWVHFSIVVFGIGFRTNFNKWGLGLKFEGESWLAELIPSSRQGKFWKIITYLAYSTSRRVYEVSRQV